MKKILILFIGVLFTWNVVYAQAPTLNFRINNPRIEQISSSGIKSFLCFDVQVSATTSGTFFDGLQSVFTFYISGLDASTTFNRKILKGPLATGDDGGGNQFYNISQSWVPATNKLFVGVASDPLWAGFLGSSGYFNEITTSYQTLITVKIYITNKSQDANLIFVQASMNGVSTYRNESGIAQYYTSPYNYGSHDLYYAHLGRIHSTFNGWSQAGNTVVGTGWTDWTVSENTTVWDGNGHITNTNALVTGLYVDPSAVITIDPTKSLTASGTSHFTDANSILIASSILGTGSFKDNGTITYGTSGSADVQTFIKNSSSPGSFFAHLVGPTVNDPAFQTTMGYTGAYLQSFDLAGHGTYAYEYMEPINDWSNIYLLTTPVKTAKGILLSTIDQTNHIMTMTGQLLTGTVTSAPMQHGTNGIELLSNPYPSSLDWHLFYAANSSNITNTYRIYDPSIAQYVFYSISGGGTLTTKDIQVGQGFFVETLNAAPAIFDNTMRLHSTAPFLKNEYAYQLRLNLEGNGYKDATFIYFKPEGTVNYDQLHDVYKWWSMQTEASELWTVGSDQSLLSMNSLPVLGNSTVSVPMNFKCGAEGTYTISAENIGSFDAGTDIFLEDLVTGAAWYNLVQNPVYEFTGIPSGDQNRFIVHFFGPTGINDPDGASLVNIYGYGQDAYIVNRGKETIKEYVAYDMMGRELHRGTLPNNTVNKVWVGNVSAYYIVKVITKEGRIYTDKVYITK